MSEQGNLNSPTPWVIEGTLIRAERGEVVCDVFGRPSCPNTRANLALIVRAVNSHASLVAACEALIAHEDREDGDYHDVQLEWKNMVSGVRAALAQEKGGSNV